MFKIRTTDGRAYTTEDDIVHSRLAHWVRAYDENGHQVWVQTINIVEFDDGLQVFDRKPRRKSKEAGE